MPSLRAVFAKMEWQSKKAFGGLPTQPLRLLGLKEKKALRLSFHIFFCEVLFHKKIKTTLKRVSAVRSHSRAIKGFRSGFCLCDCILWGFFVIASRFCKNGVAIQKSLWRGCFGGLPTLEAQTPLWRLTSNSPSLAEGLGVGFKTHHTTFERACVPLLGWRKLHPFLCTKFLSYFYYKPKILWIFRLFYKRLKMTNSLS